MPSPRPLELRAPGAMAAAMAAPRCDRDDGRAKAPPAPCPWPRRGASFFAGDAGPEVLDPGGLRLRPSRVRPGRLSGCTMVARRFRAPWSLGRLARGVLTWSAARSGSRSGCRAVPSTGVRQGPRLEGSSWLAVGFLRGGERETLKNLPPPPLHGPNQPRPNHYQVRFQNWC